MPVWSSDCIDEVAGLDICDPVSGKFYKDDEARMLSAEVKRRLVMRPRKLGRYVMTADEAEECILRR